MPSTSCRTFQFSGSDLCPRPSSPDVLEVVSGRQIAREGPKMTEDNMNFEALLDPGEAAQLLKVNRATLLRMARAGQLPAIKVGKLWRFRKSQLDEWLRSKVSFAIRAANERKERKMHLRQRYQ